MDFSEDKQQLELVTLLRESLKMADQLKLDLAAIRISEALAIIESTGETDH